MGWDTELIKQLVREIPLSMIVILALLLYFNLKNINKKINQIENKLIPLESFKEAQIDIKDLRERKVWRDVFDTVVEDVKNRIERIEKFVNGKAQSRN